MPIECQSMPTRCQSSVNLMSIKSQFCANPLDSIAVSVFVFLRRLPKPPECGCRISPNFGQYSVEFPQIWASERVLRNFEAVFRLFVMKLSEPKVLQVNLSVRGRAKPSRNLSCSQFSLRWGPSKILHPLSGGCGSRLSICQAQVNASKRQNKYWDSNAV